MSRVLYALLIAALALAVVAPVTLAQGNGNAGKSGIVHLWLAPDPADEDEGGLGDADVDPNAWGRITYHGAENALGKFVFNGKNLTAGATYELRSGGNSIAQGTANGGGNVNINSTHAVENDENGLGAFINLWRLGENGEPDIRVLRADLPEDE